MTDRVQLSKIKYWQSQFAGRTVPWMGGEDHEENFDLIMADAQSRALLQSQGWTKENVSYSLNKDGFRGPAKQDIKGKYFCAFGCSITFGQSMNFEDTYGSQLADMLGMGYLNFGISGGSDDGSVRLAITHLNDLTPEFVVFQTTFDHRYESISNNFASTYGVQPTVGGKVPLDDGVFFRDWIVNDVNRQLNQDKNIMAIKWLCHERSIPLYIISIDDFLSAMARNGDYARDLRHPGRISHREIANNLYQRIQGEKNEF